MFPLYATDRYDWNVAIVQPIFTGYALSTKYEMAKLNIDLKEVEITPGNPLRDKIGEDGDYYVLHGKKSLGVADDAVENLEAHARMPMELQKHDLIPHNDLLQSQVALANARQNREKARMANEMALSALNMLLGGRDDRADPNRRYYRPFLRASFSQPTPRPAHWQEGPN